MAVVRPRREVAAPYRPKPWCIETACMRLHNRRVTCVEFVPGSPCLVASGDKKGHLAMWDFDKVYERTLYDNVHGYQVSAMKFVAASNGEQLLTASADGTAKVVDMETGMHFALCDLNPGGWIEGVSTEKNWCMAQSITAHASAPHVAFTGDSFGQLHCLDLRAKDVQWVVQAHTSRSKVTSLDMHPRSEHLLLTASNDYSCKIFDIRTLGAGQFGAGPASSKVCAEDLVALAHPRVVSAAYFSPHTGNSILTTCQDNRIRIWDQPHHLDAPASREMVHSHDFNRYLTPFRAVWDAKDRRERVFVIGRYISEDFGGLAVHPVDIIDGSTGALLEQLQDPNLELINPVNMPHPFLDVIITGASGHLFCWRPAPEDEEEALREEAEGGAATEWELASPGRDAGGASTSAAAAGPRPALKGSSRYHFFDAKNDEKKQTKKKGSSEAGEAKGKGDKSGSGTETKKSEKKSEKTLASATADGAKQADRKGKSGKQGKSDDAKEPKADKEPSKSAEKQRKKEAKQGQDKGAQATGQTGKRGSEAADETDKGGAKDADQQEEPKGKKRKK